MEWKFIFSNPTYGTTVIDEPIGWSDIAINIKRDLASHGVFFDYAISLQFRQSGYHYLKNAYNTGGIDQYVGLNVQVKCSETDIFEDFYTGKLLLAKLVFDCSDKCFAECPVEPSGCLMKFRNRIDQKVDLQLCEDYDKNALACYNFLPYTIKMKPKLVVKKSAADACYDSTCLISDAYDTPAGTGNSIVINYDTYVQPCIGSLNLNEVDTVNSIGLRFASDPSTVDDIIVASKTGVYKLDFKFNFDVLSTVYTRTESVVCTPSGGVCGPNPPNSVTVCGQTLDLYLNGEFDAWEVDGFVTVNGANVHTQNFIYELGVCHTRSGIGISFTDAQLINNCFAANLSLSLNANDVVKVFWKIHQGGDFKLCVTRQNEVRFANAFSIHTNTSCIWKFSLQSETLEDPTNSKVYMINEAFSRVTENITNDCMRVKSNYFGRTDSQPYTSPQDGCGSLESITVGKHLRQFPDNLCLMNPSFKDLFDSMNSIHNIGYGVEPDINRTGFEWLRIEPMAYWYDNSVLMSCFNIPEIKLTVKAEWYISLFDFGYNKWEAEQTSGLDEFAVKKQYRTTFREVKQTLSKRVEFIGSGYAIENTRSEKYNIDTTKDWRWDNDIFVICVRRDGTATTPYSLISVEQGVDCINVGTALNIIDPGTIYNARISPNRNFLRWMPYLMANYFFDINDSNSYFRFVDGQGNYLAEMELINGCLYEKSGKNLKENEDISSTDTNTLSQSYPIYNFETVEYDYPMSFNQFKFIKANPRGTITYQSADMPTPKSGFIYSISYKPNEGIATFTLLPKFIP